MTVDGDLMRFGKRKSGQLDVNQPGASGTSARVVETHISTIFFVGERVYKMRKPVQFDFLDFRRRINRRTDCEREVALNRRLAPDVYLGVADLVLEGKPIDHMVVMRRLPENRCLAALARRGDPPSILGCSEWRRRWCHFTRRPNAHQRSRRTQAGRRLRSIWRDSFAETSPYVGTHPRWRQEAEIRHLVTRWLDGRNPLLDDRIASQACVRRARRPPGRGHLLSRRRSPDPRLPRVFRPSPPLRCYAPM